MNRRSAPRTPHRDRRPTWCAPPCGAVSERRRAAAGPEARPSWRTSLSRSLSRLPQPSVRTKARACFGRLPHLEQPPESDASADRLPGSVRAHCGSCGRRAGALRGVRPVPGRPDLRRRPRPRAAAVRGRQGDRPWRALWRAAWGGAPVGWVVGASRGGASIGTLRQMSALGATCAPPPHEETGGKCVAVHGRRAGSMHYLCTLTEQNME